MVASIKCYIKAANKRKILIRQSQKEADIEKNTDREREIEVRNKIKKNEACQFQVIEINQFMKELKAEFKIERDEVEDEQLLQMKNT